MLCVVTEFAQMGLLTSKATGPRGGEMGPRGGEAPAEAEKETMVEGAAKLAGAPICRKKVSRDRRKTPSMPPAFAAGGCRYLLSFFIPAAGIFFVAVVSSTLLLRRSRISSFSVSRYSRGGKEKKAAKRNTSESSRCCPAVAAAAAAPFFFPNPFFTHFQGRVGL